MPEQEHYFSLKSLFVPLTIKKATYIIIIIGLLIFGTGLFNNFVADDLPLIVYNPKVQSISNIFSFFQGGQYYSSQQGNLSGIYYKPVTLTLFALISSIFGLNPFFFHGAQLLIQIINSIFVFYLFKYFFNKKLAFFLSLIFLVHPINSETVLYIANLQESLFFIFGISSLLLIMYKTKTYLVRYLAPALLLLSLLSKESGILYFLIIVTFILIFIKKQKLIQISSFIPALLIYALLRIPAVGIYVNSPKASPIMYADLFHRLLTVPLIMSSYILGFFYPFNLPMSNNVVVETANFGNFYIPVIIDLFTIICILTLGVFIWYKKSDKKLIYLFFCLWFIIGLSIHLQIIPLDQTIAYRWFYFPIVGLLGIIGTVISSIKIKTVYVKNVLFMFSITLIILLSMITFIRSSDWRDGITLYTHDLKLNPNDYFMEGNLGYELFQRGDLQGAQQEIEKSVTAYPYSVINYSNYCTITIILGNTNKDSGLKEKGIKCYEKMINLFDQASVYERLVVVLMKNNQTNTALYYSGIAIKKFPQDSNLWLYLGEIEYQKNELNNAISPINHAYYLNPTNPAINSLYEKLHNRN